MTCNPADYTDEEKDAVIEYCNLGFMRNRLKAQSGSDSDMASLLGTFAGRAVVLNVRFKRAVARIVSAGQGDEN